MNLGFHHFHKTHQDKEVVKSSRLESLVNGLVYLGGVFGPLFTIPQMAKIWVDKNAAGVSAISWGAYFLGSVFWVVYGVVHKEKPIIILNSIWLVLDLIIIIGVFFYG